MAQAKKTTQLPSGRLRITKGRWYIIERENNEQIEITDDTGNENFYDKDNFIYDYLKFTCGKKVRFNGLEGKVVNVCLLFNHPIQVLFNNNETMSFTATGKLFEEQTEPCIVLL